MLLVKTLLDELKEEGGLAHVRVSNHDELKDQRYVSIKTIEKGVFIFFWLYLGNFTPSSLRTKAWSLTWHGVWLQIGKRNTEAE